MGIYKWIPIYYLYMKSLIDYIFESVLSKRFENSTGNFQTLLTKVGKLNIRKFPELKSFFNEVLNGNPNQGSDSFIYSMEATYFKMPYEYTPIIKTLASTHPDITIKENGGEKISLYYSKKKIMETGRCSIDKVSTSLQEGATCSLFNICMSIGEKEDVDLTKLKDLEYIKNVLIDVCGTEAEIFNKSWLASFGKQVLVLAQCISGMNLDPRNYRMTRYGNSDVVAQSYTGMVKSYTKWVGGEGRNMKDVFDPSDVILYLNSAEPKIEEICVEGSDTDSCIKIKDRYKEELFIKHICMGVSLKKITARNGRIDMFNIGSDNLVQKVTEVSICDTEGKGMSVICKGKFNFDGVVDENGEYVGKQREVIVTMRTFGSGNVGVDVKLREPGSPALGKCPVNIWRSILGCKMGDDINTCVDKFRELVSKESCEEMMQIIKYAVKEGPHCFPFLLIH